MEKLRPQPLRLFVVCLGLALLAGLNGCGWGGSLPEFFLRVPQNTNVQAGNQDVELKVLISPNTSYDIVRPGMKVRASFSSSSISCVEKDCVVGVPPGLYQTAFHFNVASNAPLGMTDITFTANSGFSTQSVAVTITVTPPDFTAEVQPTRATILRGDPIPGFNLSFFRLLNPVTAAATPPPGFTCLQPACTLTLFNGFFPSAITMTVDPNIAPGVYPIPFVFTTQGTFGPESITAYSTITIVTQEPDFILNAFPATSSIASAGFVTAPFSVSVMPLNSFIEPVTVTASAPPGFHCLENPCSSTTNDMLNWTILDFFQFSTDPTLASGPYTITFTGTSGTKTHTSTAIVNVH
jgi:hypothetical protein